MKTIQELSKQIEQLKPWYHSIRIPCSDGTVTTPGEPYEDLWAMIRKTRTQLDYKNAKVLDVAAFDGMWSFEAEQLGACQVLATDINWRALPAFNLVQRALNSEVIPLYNVSVYNLTGGLHYYLTSHNHPDGHHKHSLPHGEPQFDIVQNMGLLYHLRDPMRALMQCRAVIKDRGKLLIETAYHTSPDAILQANIIRGDQCTIYPDSSTWWAPSISALHHMLEATLFKPLIETALTCQVYPGHPIARIALVAEAVPLNEANPNWVYDFQNMTTA